MSLKLYFLRHGETIYSETGAYCGEVDAELTPEGDQTAEGFAEAYRSAPCTAACGSPMKRTIATAANKDSSATYRAAAIAIRNRQRLERKIKASIRCPLVGARSSFSCLHRVQMIG